MDDHDAFMRSVEALKPDVAIERLPAFVVRTFSSSSASKSSNREEESSVAAAEAVGPALWESLMPFQKTGVSFALVRTRNNRTRRDCYFILLSALDQ